MARCNLRVRGIIIFPRISLPYNFYGYFLPYMRLPLPMEPPGIIFSIFGFGYLLKTIPVGMAVLF